jgi:hypothetical protein
MFLPWCALQDVRVLTDKIKGLGVAGESSLANM